MKNTKNTIKMTDKRRNIKVSDATFQVLKDDKPEGVTWDYYLLNLRTPNLEDNALHD